METGTAVKILHNSTYHTHLDKIDFFVTKILPEGAIEVKAGKHGAITCRHGKSKVLDGCKGIRIPKNALEGAVYTFKAWAVVEKTRWEKAKVLCEKHGLSMGDALQVREGEEPVQEEQAQEEAAVPQKLRRAKKNFSKKNIFDAIKDIAGRSLVYDGCYVSDGFVAVKQTSDFIPGAEDTHRNGFSSVVSNELSEPTPVSLSTALSLQFYSVDMWCYAELVGDCVLAVRKAHVDMYRQYYPGCTFKIDADRAKGDVYRSPIQVFNTSGEWRGIIMPSIPNDVEAVKANL